MTAKELENKTKIGSVFTSPAGWQRKVIVLGNNEVSFKSLSARHKITTYTFHDLINMNYRLKV